MRTAAAALPRFLVVGAGTAAASALAIGALVQGMAMTPIAAAAIVAIAGNVVGFVLNRKWSFLAAHEHPLRQLLRYLTVATVAVVTSVALFALLTEALGLHYLLASLVVSALFAAANFLAHFHWSFAERRPGRRLA